MLAARSYSYSDIEGIYSAPAFTSQIGRVVPRREYVVVFRDERKWTTNCTPVLLSVDRKTHLLAYISLKSLVPNTEKQDMNRGESYGY